MAEHVLFLTGKLAEPQLQQVLAAMQPDFSYTVHVLGLKVAALMTADMIKRRLHDTFGADWVMVPGRCRGDLQQLSQDLGIRFVRGPDEIKDIPGYFGKFHQKPDLSNYAVRIFAEITDAPNLDLDGILRQAQDYRQDGADVIDLGCLPSTPFPHMESAIQALHAAGFLVSIDSLDEDDLIRGGRAGADYLLSLNENNLWISDSVSSTPVLIPATHGDLASLERTMAVLDAKNRHYLVDPILDPIHFGFTDSLVRYQQIRQRYPKVEILMGVGNLTELTHADTVGINTILLGICSELNITAILATQVSRHARSAVREADAARRIMYAAKSLNTVPKHIDDRLMALHSAAPSPYSYAELKELQTQIRDPSYRIQITPEAIHIFNRSGLHSATNPFTLFPRLGVEHDGAHAFYLGVELARAEIAWQLGKRYNQDEPLDWGVATTNTDTSDHRHYKAPGTTLTT